MKNIITLLAASLILIWACACAGGRAPAGGAQSDTTSAGAAQPDAQSAGNVHADTPSADKDDADTPSTSAAPADSGLAELTRLPDKIELYFFYNEPCGSCDGTRPFYDLFAEKMPEYKDRYPYKVVTVNTFGSGQKTFERITAERGINTVNMNLPVMIVGGKAFSGMESIGQNLAEAYLAAGEDIFEYKYVYYPALDADKPLFWRYAANPGHSTAVYFYRAICYDCEDLKPFIGELPGTVVVNGADTPLDVIKINTFSGVNNDLVRKLFDVYEVAPDKQTVPIVFLADTYLSGYDEITKSLMEMLERGAGLNFQFP